MTLEPGGKWYERKMEEEMSVRTSLGLGWQPGGARKFSSSTRHKGLYPPESDQPIDFKHISLNPLRLHRAEMLMTQRAVVSSFLDKFQSHNR